MEKAVTLQLLKYRIYWPMISRRCLAKTEAHSVLFQAIMALQASSDPQPVGETAVESSSLNTDRLNRRNEALLCDKTTDCVDQVNHYCSLSLIQRSSATPYPSDACCT